MSIDYSLTVVYLVPPSLSSGTEIIFGPRRENDLIVVFSNITVCKSKWKRSWSTYNMTIRSILRSVAWAHEFVVGGRPWDDASQVCADSVKSVALDGLVFLDDDVTVDGKRVELFAMVLVVHH